jgi:hypothetical protein
VKPVFAPFLLLGFLAQAGAALAHQMACSPPASLAITEEDRERLTQLLSSRSRGLGEALAAEDAADRAAVGAVFREGFTPVQTVPDGQYRCRTMKLGGISPLVVYSYFDCTIRDEGTVVEKTSGSQRFTGSLTPAGGGLIYVGALHYGDEEPIRYDQDAERNQIGCLQQVAGEAKRFVLELPSPKFESVHDVIEFTTD